MYLLNARQEALFAIRQPLTLVRIAACHVNDAQTYSIEQAPRVLFLKQLMATLEKVQERGHLHHYLMLLMLLGSMALTLISADQVDWKHTDVTHHFAATQRQNLWYSSS